METDQTDAVRTLLSQAEAAHGTYEATELNGVYDQAWAGWYAAWAVEHGIGAIVGRAVTAGQLERFLTRVHAEYTQVEPSSQEPWAAYTARRITAEL